MNTNPIDITEPRTPPAVTEETAAQPNQQSLNHASEVRTLTLDLGTRTGWTLMVGVEIVESGTELLATEEELQQQRRHGNERTSDIRFYRFLDFIHLKKAAGIDRIVFEDVNFIRGQAQAQLWPSLRAAIWVRVQGSAIRVFCVPVKTLKFFATDNGNAEKSDMALALAKAEPVRYVRDLKTGTLLKNGRTVDDNEVDAIWLARFTAAVDRGEQEFLSVYNKRIVRNEQRRQKRAERKARRKALKAEEKSKLRALKVALKATGKCCGVFRKPASHGRAICPKCWQTVRIPKPVSSTRKPSASGAAVTESKNAVVVQIDPQEIPGVIR